MSKSFATSTVRIIGGNWRGRKVSFTPEKDLRPTPDRVRETLFNWLQGRIAGKRVLELFAGSGILSFEALSRGARHVTLMDQSHRVIKMLERNRDELGQSSNHCVIVQQDAFAQLQIPAKEPFDIVFIDPPFQSNGHLEIIPRLLRQHYLSRDALIYIECPSASLLEAMGQQQLSIIKQKRAGQVHFALLSNQDAF